MILVTGGAGYIGSHCALELLNRGSEVVIFDNLSIGHIETINELKKHGKLHFVKGDLLNKSDLENLFSTYKIDSTIHFAGLSQVEESMKFPDKYYQNNYIGSKNLLDCMIKHNVKKIVFSSTASIYGEPKYVPIDENHPKNPINPYGKIKLMIENMMDEYDKQHELKSVRLRYFNVVGADSLAQIGEWHTKETHLVPNILKSTFKNDKTFKLFGIDYDTKDGTCVRDYVNVEDLIKAHILALNYLEKNNQTNYFNVGTNDGNSVKEIFKTCELVVGKEIPLEECSRRAGDPAKLIADNTKIKELLNWLPKKNIKDSIKSAYSWEKKLNSMLS